MSGSGKPVIRQTDDRKLLSRCAEMMKGSDPWLRLGIGYDDLFGMLSDPSREVYVATRGEALLGVIVLEMKGAFTGYVKSICVSPDHRGEGVGKELMAYVERRVFLEKPNVFLCVSSFNADARRFYARLGYSVVGELEDYLVSGFSEVLMRKTVAPINEFKRHG